jgi:hypothetical protein
VYVLQLTSRQIYFHVFCAFSLGSMFLFLRNAEFNFIVPLRSHLRGNRCLCFPVQHTVLSAFAKLRIATTGFIMPPCLSLCPSLRPSVRPAVRPSIRPSVLRPSVRPSVWNDSASTGWMFVKFCISVFSKICRENSVFITNPSDKNNGYFT